MNNQLPEIKNPLKHTGTNRFERLAKEMDFDYVQIEERHESDFLQYAAKLTQSIQYYDHNNQPFGSWQSFFDESVPSNRPHKALFIAFLRLLEALNQHANGLTKRHLDFYYREVLQFTERQAMPDRVHLFFNCAKTLKERFIEEGAALLAGENDEGKKILYKLVDEIVVNKAKLTHFFSVYRHEADFGNRIFSKDYSTLALGDPAENKNGFPPFGEQQRIYVKDLSKADYKLEIRPDLTMDIPSLGFAISAQMLRMEEGLRTITLKFVVESPVDAKLDSADFECSVSTEDGWYPVYVKKAELTGELFELELVLQNTDPAIVNYSAEVHEGDYRSKTPVLRLLFKNHDPFGYGAAKGIRISDLRLSVNVEGVRSLIVQNDQAVLDPSKPFRPFGAVPTIGSNFYIGHPEIFKNKLIKAETIIQWKDVPKAQMEDHYVNYSGSISNQIFKVETALLQQKEWGDSELANLFGSNALDRTIIAFNVLDSERKTDDFKIESWGFNTPHGFLKMSLSGTPGNAFRAFGHLAYPKDAVRVNLENSKKTASEPLLEINPPYTPVIEEITFDYTTEEVCFADQVGDHFYHVMPYGQKPLKLEKGVFDIALFPEFADEGECYLGLEELELPQSISLLFQFIEGTGDASQSQIKSNVQWHYLKGNEWKKIDRLRISKDTTRNLLNTGIIRFDLPREMDADHQIMPNGLYWLKATMPIKTAGLDYLQGVHVQAAEAVELEPEINSQVIEPGSITKLANGGRGIAKIEQPYASFGGTNQNDESNFYARITERLRHKDRGIMIWDYERLILDAFPELYKVKCLNHTNYKTELVAGHVMMAIIPNLRRKGLHSPFQPKLSIHKRMEIYDFLRERISPFIYLRVENPIYEPIQLSFNVGFHEGRDEGFYGKKLHQQLQEFLSPWAFDNGFSETNDLVFGGELHKSTLLKFIEDLEYVDFVNDFNMYHIYQDPTASEKFYQKKSQDPNEAEFELNQTNRFSKAITEGPCDRIIMRFNSENTVENTELIDIKVRLLKGMVDLDDGDTIQDKFRRQLYNALRTRSAKGQTITKTLIRILVKNMHYVDKIVSLNFYIKLPGDYIMEDVDVAEAKTSRSVMVTAEQHRIGVYRAGDYNCEGSVVIGIGFMIVEADFIIPQLKEESYEYKAR